MEKKRVADILEEIAVLLEASGESPFKSRAYQNAARIIRNLAADPDAHDLAGLTDVRVGVAVARRAGLGSADVLNTVPVDRLDAALRRRVSSS